MIELEGQEWFDQNDIHFGRSSIKKALEKLEAERARIEKYKESDPERYQREVKDNDMVAGMYGSGGFSRYFIRLDGTVTYSMFHGNKNKEAKELGFELF